MSATGAGKLGQTAGQAGLPIQRCTNCGHVPNFPRARCPRCFGVLESQTTTAGGRVKSFAIVRRTHDDIFAPHLPIVLALIDLDEGSETISTIVDETRLSTEVGARVVPCQPELNWSILPQFAFESSEK